MWKVFECDCDLNLIENDCGFRLYLLLQAIEWYKFIISTFYVTYRDSIARYHFANLDIKNLGVED